MDKGYGYTQIRSASRQAGVSTASMGKFDKRLEGEKEGERLLGSKRRKYEPVAGKTSQELSKVVYHPLIAFSKNIPVATVFLHTNEKMTPH